MISRKISFYFLLLLLIIPFSVYAQFSSQKEKYWIYRERLKNFMVSSHGAVCKGCDIPDRDRENTINGTDKLVWADIPWFIGLKINNTLIFPSSFSFSLNI